MQLPDCLDDVGEGWRPLLLTLHQDLLQLEPTYGVSQVKEKFGELRVYLNESTREMEACVQRATALSGVTCEWCGAPAKMRIHHRSWLITLCDPCSGKRDREEYPKPLDP